MGMGWGWVFWIHGFVPSYVIVNASPIHSPIHSNCVCVCVWFFLSFCSASDLLQYQSPKTSPPPPPTSFWNLQTPWGFMDLSESYNCVSLTHSSPVCMWANIMLSHSRSPQHLPTTLSYLLSLLSLPPPQKKKKKSNTYPHPTVISSLCLLYLLRESAKSSMWSGLMVGSTTTQDPPLSSPWGGM